MAVEARGRFDKVKGGGGGEVCGCEDLGVCELGGFEDEFEGDGGGAEGAEGGEFAVEEGVVCL